MQAILKTAPHRKQPTVREFVVLEGGAGESKGKRRYAPKRSAIIIGVCLATLQILDGVLTHMGIERFGMQAEYNLILRELMTIFNPAAVLTVLKLLAIAVIAFLTAMSTRFRWVKSAMASVSVFYLVVAVLPWIVVLFFRHPA